MRVSKIKLLLAGSVDLLNSIYHHVETDKRPDGYRCRSVRGSRKCTWTQGFSGGIICSAVDRTLLPIPFTMMLIKVMAPNSWEVWRLIIAGYSN